MAVKRSNNGENTNPDVQVTPDADVNTTPAEETKTADTTPDTAESAESAAQTETKTETPDVQVTPEEKIEDSGVSVDPSALDVPTVDVSVETPNINVKVRMRADHRCTIAMVRYDFKKGQTYTVPQNVKRILNDAGLLAPL